MKGRKNIMEKLLQFLMFIGVTLVVAGTVTACSIKDTTIKDAATSVETPVENKQQKYDNHVSELEQTQKKIAEETAKEDIYESSGDAIDLEVQLLWERYTEVLKPFIDNGLDYKTFSDIYSIYRVGNEDVISADDAYQMTYRECERRFKVEEQTEEVVDIGFEGNITENSDGTYEYAEQFMIEMRKRPYFEGATDEEIITFLDEVIGYFDGVEDEIDSEMMDSMLDAFDGGNLHEENLVIAESESGVTQNVDRNNNGSGSNNNKSGNKNNQGGNSTHQNSTPAPEQDGSSADWGAPSGFPGQVGPVGGGEQVVPDGFVVH